MTIPETQYVLTGVKYYTKDMNCSALYISTGMSDKTKILRMLRFITFEMADILSKYKPLILEGDHETLERHFWECPVNSGFTVKLIRNGEVVLDNSPRPVEAKNV